MPSERDAVVQAIIGYLNFSDGTPSAAFQRALNDFFRDALNRGGDPAWVQLNAALSDRLASWTQCGSPFGDVAQAMKIVRSLFDEVLPAYRRFHRDLMFHLSDDELFQPFFLARVLEATLGQSQKGVRKTPADDQSLTPVDPDATPLARAAIDQLNDFVGHRPIPVLENERLLQTYAHERVRPIPIYLKDAGVGVGPHEALVAAALELLRRTDAAVLGEVWFDPNQLEELSLDPRAYDYSHPVNQRPGYQFGEWDPYLINAKGRYRRFIIRPLIIDVLLEWLHQTKDVDSDEAQFEASAVLAGTILLASGVSGGGPADLDSEATAASLVVRISQCRDKVYADLVARRPGPHGDKLRAEAQKDRQSFSRLRQYLNLQLGKRRAAQLLHDHLAQTFAQMGFPKAAEREIQIIPTASARLRCEIENLFIAGGRKLEEDDVAGAAACLPLILRHVKRAIACGATVDPWNMLAFQGQFPLFNHSPESISDPRVEQLLEVMERLFDLHARILADAAARGEQGVEAEVSDELAAAAIWWDQYAAYEVAGLRRVCGRELAQSARFVAETLADWRQSGEAAGNIAFWRSRAEGFNTPQTYALVVEALLQKQDLVAAAALLVHWLSQAESVPMEDSGNSFATLAKEWLASALSPVDSSPAGAAATTGIVRRFFDHLEANADDYWRVPGAEILGGEPDLEDVPPTDVPGDSLPEVEPEGDEVFSAAYEGVTFKDSAADGHEGEMMEAGGAVASDESLLIVAESLDRRLTFLSLVARLWQWATLAPWTTPQQGDEPQSGPGAWAKHAADFRRRLLRLLDKVHHYSIASPGGDAESLSEFGRQHAIKEEILNRIILTAIEAGHAACSLYAVGLSETPPDGLADWERQIVKVRAALLRGDREAVRRRLPALFIRLKPLPVLYVPIHLGGDPRLVADARYLRDALRKLAVDLPSLGLFRETFHLLRTAQEMERNQLADIRQVTEFDSLFTVGYRAVIESLVAHLPKWAETAGDDEQAALLVGGFVGRFSKLWTNHILGVRLSELERRTDHREWETTVRFIKKYGRELFTQKFLQLGNLRGILHQGVGGFLESMEKDPEGDEAPKTLLEDLDNGLPRAVAIEQLEFILQVVSSHYDVYKDYNLTTNQSDYGDNLYVLLELLRVQTAYERNRWALRPAYVAHRILTAGGRPAAAMLLQRAFIEETAGLADGHLHKLATVEKKFGLRLATVADRLAEKFAKPLQLDRVLALVEPAMEAAESNDESRAFDLFYDELADFTTTPTGGGMEVPSWLRQLESEVQRVRKGDPEEDDLPVERLRRLSPTLGYAELKAQIELWEKPLT